MPATTRMDSRTLLGRSLLFRALAPADLDRIISLARIRDLNPGETLFRKGEPADAVYAVLRGSVRVVSRSEDGREVTLRILPAGEVFGELGLLHQGHRTATIVAGEDCGVLAIGRREFMGLLEQRPKVAIQLLGALAARIDELTAELSDLVFLGLPARLAKKLLELARLYGEPCGDGIRIARRVSQQDLANLVGTSRESVNKQLRSWEERGILEVRRWQLTLRQPATLEALVAAARMAKNS
ncbi:MAG: Crp/Fnr family transcriptional regulator [Acidobacteria bacterium]|nr:Crp/Fnr family transcriptional regulator [Acidobacteriota bacterium]